MNRALVLVDLDNVHELLAAAPVPSVDEGGHDAVVVVAMNTTTARRVCRRWGDVSDAVARVLGLIDRAWMLRLRPAFIEVALVPTMPQAADLALARLRDRAPDPSTAGPFDWVAVATRDHGLRAALAPPRMAPRRMLPGAEAPWLGLRSGPPLVRHGPAPAEPFPPAEGAPRGPHVPLVVLGPDVAESVCADVPLPWVVHEPLLGLAAAVDRCPSFLSQVGLTRWSVAGVWAMAPRLTSAPDGRPPRLSALRSLDPGDGVEVSGGAALPRLDGWAEEAITGIGAVRFPRIHLTASTCLPWRAWLGAEGAWLEHAWQLDDAALLARNAGASLPAVQVRVCEWRRSTPAPRPAGGGPARKGRVVAFVRGEVLVERGGHPEAWWVGPLRAGAPRQARSVMEVAGGWVVPESMDVVGVPTVVDTLLGAQLDLRPSDHEQPALVRLRSAAPCHFIVRARDAAGRGHAVLLGEGDPDRTEVLALPLWRVAPGHPLARLPVLVEVDEHGVSASASLDVPPSQSEP